MTTHLNVPVPGGLIPVFDDGTGPPLILLHAGVADSSSWDDVAAPLGAAGYRTIRYDQRGYGRSYTEPVEYSPRGDLWAVMDACGVERAVLVGNSIGGSIAIDAALEQPDRVCALVLVGTGLSGFDEAPPTAVEEEAFNEIDRAFTEGRYLDAIEARVKLWVDGIGRPPERVAASVREHERTMLLPSAASEGSGASRLGIEPEASARLEELLAPTCVVLGEYDTSIIHQIAEALVQRIPHAHLVQVPDAAHMVGMEHPALLASLILEHIASLDRWS